MKRTILISVVLMIATVAGCQQKKEEKNQIIYAPPAVPTQMEIDRLQQAAKNAPKSSQAWITLGDVLMDSQRYVEAIEAYQKGLALDPKNVSARVDMGTCYRGARQFDKAVEEYRKALKINPDFPTAHRNLGVVLTADLHDTKQGVKEFQRYLELAPNAPDAEMIKQSIRELSAAKQAGK